MLSVQVILKFTLLQFDYLKLKAEILNEKVLSERLCIKTFKGIFWLDEGINYRNTYFFLKILKAKNTLLQWHHHSRTI